MILHVLGYADTFQKFTVGEEGSFLPLLFETVCIVQLTGALCQAGGKGDVQHLSIGMFQLFQGQRGLAAACGTDHDQGRRQQVHSLLGVVEGDNLIQQVNFTPLGMNIAHRLRLHGSFGQVEVRQFVLVQLSSAQKA